jgi:aquaporin Z
MASPDPTDPPVWRAYGAELVGTGLLVLIGLSVVILAFGEGSPVADWIPPPGLRRLIAGLLFGATGAGITVSPLGRASGAHINPAVTLAFWLEGKIESRHAACYVASQLAGGVAGAVPLLAWGALGRSIGFASTSPGAGVTAWGALLGEVVVTFGMVFLMFVLLARPATRSFTPLLFPAYFGLAVLLEAPVSGTSANPARSLGPAVVAGVWRAHWVYWLGPLLGAALAAGIVHFELLGRHHAPIAKLFHFQHDPYGIFHVTAARPGG